MAKTSLAFVFALLLALPIHSVFANEVNPLNLFDGVEAPVEAKTFDWVLEAKNLETDKKIPTIFDKKVQAPAASPRRVLVESPKLAPQKAFLDLESLKLALRRNLVQSPELAPQRAFLDLKSLKLTLRRNLVQSPELAPQRAFLDLESLKLALRRTLAESPKLAPQSAFLDVESLKSTLKRALAKSPELAPRKILVETLKLAPRSAPAQAPTSSQEKKCFFMICI
ncbi:uncharacterized protein LOC107648602 [Arachis ipaensis]|uniref:uncharacterized protein LOC107648602 n=1 Tax=Arachis ipaensis TaxID=130454 RepID=UPI0007AF91AE|nr:uncharacterized protein LOC107648602 [Arachis ipaensis]